MQFKIENEYDRLEAVLIHRPGQEIDRLNYDNMKRFLFEDAPFLRRMQEEHDAFAETMRQRGIEVYYLRDLVMDVLRDDGLREGLVREVCQTAVVPALAGDLTGLKHWPLEELCDLLFAGITADEYHERTGKRIATPSSDEFFLLPPVPNAYFSRDPAVVVGGAAISCKMHYRERVRETLLVRAVLEHHPEFRDNAITYGGSDEPTEDRPYTIEGGDVLILSPEAVLVGDSERTRSETIELLAQKLFHYGNIQRVYEITIPPQREFMHLDTVFTILDHGKVLLYSDVMGQVQNIFRCERGDGKPGSVRRVREERSLRDVLSAEFGKEIEVIDTAGGNPRFASREQRNDATNALAIAPSVAITYERNERTVAALEEAEVTCVGIDDSELVRGLGGPRCMTMPLRRMSS